jgi:hypothetical protein
MLLRWKIILLTLFFGGALGGFSWKEEWYFYVLIFLLFFSLFFVWPLVEKLRFLAIPFFLSIGSLNLLYLVDGKQERILFIIFAASIYYLSLLGAYRLKKYDCDQTAQGMINLATIATVFFWLVSNYGWYLNFAIDSWVLIVTTIASTFLIAFPSLTICFVSCYKIKYRQEKTLQKIKKRDFLVALKQQLKVQQVALFFSIILAFIMGEIIWGLSLWPFGYLVTGMTAVIIFFIFWSIIRRFIMKRLTKRYMFVNISLMIILIMGMLLTSPWNLID